MKLHYPVSLSVLFSNETAQKLYFDYAATTPVLDYHCHINPQEIYEDRQFENITQVWLGGVTDFLRLCCIACQQSIYKHKK
jgi:glucuronate isomerase